jgi:hypothetical protein
MIRKKGRESEDEGSASSGEGKREKGVFTKSIAQFVYAFASRLTDWKCYRS